MASSRRGATARGVNAVTIPASELAALRLTLAGAPSAARSPRPDAAPAPSRDTIAAIDAERLRAKAANGDADEESVAAMAKELGESSEMRPQLDFYVVLRHR